MRALYKALFVLGLHRMHPPRNGRDECGRAGALRAREGALMRDWANDHLLEFKTADGPRLLPPGNHSLLFRPAIDKGV